MKRFFALVTLCLSVWAVIAGACGPDLTSAFLLRSREILRAPEAWLGFQIRHVVHEPALPKPLARVTKAQNLWKQSLPSTLEVDVQDLREALAKAKATPSDIGLVVAEYQKLRYNQLAHWDDAEQRSLPEHETIRRSSLKSAAPLYHAWIHQGQWPAIVPQEFRLYSEGVENLHLGDEAKARDAWRKVLALPLSERSWRSAWAAWMLYKTAGNTNDAIHWLEAVCEVIQHEKCRDSLRMHPAALAFLAGLNNEPASLNTLALHYYNAKANERGDYYGKLNTTARELAIGSDRQLAAEAASDPATREVITRLLSSWADGHMPDPNLPQAKADDSNGSHELTEILTKWADALEQAKVTEDSSLGEFAIALYRMQQYMLARRYITKGSATWETLWIQAKLDLQLGDQAAAARHMGQALHLFPLEEKKHIVSQTETIYERPQNGERPSDEYLRGLRNSRFLADNATMRLGITDFATALKLFLDADCPHDAAYIAEQLMTPEELIRFIREHTIKYGSIRPAAPAEGMRDEGYSFLPPDYCLTNNRFLYVSARKLAREHWFKDALPLMPEPLRPLFAKYITLYRAGHSSVLKPDIRARFLMEAARIHRWQGMELFGADGEPDASIWNGNYPPDPLSRVRDGLHRHKDCLADWSRNPPWVETDPSIPLPLLASAEEAARLQGNMLRGKPRFHYRGEAAEMAWEAAHLLPKESNDASAMLGEGGMWLATSPRQADRFYKEMVWKHWTTPMAREADEHHWFPPSVQKGFTFTELLERPLPAQ